MKRQGVDPRGLSGGLHLTWCGRRLFRWRWKHQLLQRILPPPFLARHAEYSLIASTDDDVQASDRLLNIALAALQQAAQIRLDALDKRVLAGSPCPPSRWPGDHYRLLAALVAVMRPRLVVEIGTGAGMSALALKEHLPADGQIVTFDLLPWQKDPETCLTQADFADGRLMQHAEDISDPAIMPRYQPLLRRAELVFLDAAKDGLTEPALLAHLQQIPFVQPPLLVLDDIRVWTMLKVWRDIPYPKLDVTSFGHWTGTGLVDWLGKENRVSCEGIGFPSN